MILAPSLRRANQECNLWWTPNTGDGTILLGLVRCSSGSYGGATGSKHVRAEVLQVFRSENEGSGEEPSRQEMGGEGLGRTGESSHRGMRIAEQVGLRRKSRGVDQGGEAKNSDEAPEQQQGEHAREEVAVAEEK